jgi:hypothetical protein
VRDVYVERAWGLPSRDRKGVDICAPGFGLLLDDVLDGFPYLLVIP